MQKVKLPLTIDPARATDKRLDFEGIYPKKLFRRLAELVVDIDDDIQANVSFHRDEQQLIVISGKISCFISLNCQRCGQVLNENIQSEFCVSPIRHDNQAKDLPEQYDPIELNSFGEIELLAIVEDELILSLPIVAMHKLEHCEVSSRENEFGVLPENEQKNNPFSILASIKHK